MLISKTCNLACLNAQLTARMSPNNHRIIEPYCHKRVANILGNNVPSKSEAFCWAKDTTSLKMTERHILPDYKEPILSEVSNGYIPIIDMNNLTDIIVRQISSACEEYGFFQIINHMIAHELCQTMLDVILDLFHSPPEYKAEFFSPDTTKDVRICHYYRTDKTTKEKISFWSEVFKHSWHPVDDFTHTLPVNPPKYRVQANYYPPCPNPEQILGLGEHTDRDALTIILPTLELDGLQVMKDDKWIVVNPLPNAIFVNVGDQLQVLSNGRCKSVLHRAITNKTRSRVSLAMFYGSGKDTIIGPIGDLIDENHPPVYQSYRFSEFLDEFRRQENNNTRIRVKEAFETMCPLHRSP